MDSPFEEQWYTVKEVAELLKISRFTINRLIQSEELSAVRVGREYRVSNTSLVAYLNRGDDFGK